jgi:hypothetical protein
VLLLVVLSFSLLESIVSINAVVAIWLVFSVHSSPKTQIGTVFSHMFASPRLVEIIFLVLNLKSIVTSAPYFLATTALVDIFRATQKSTLEILPSSRQRRLIRQGFPVVFGGFWKGDS